MGTRNLKSYRLLISLCIAVSALSSCKIELNSGLEEKEANEMLSQLALHDIDVSKQVDKDKTVSVWVEKDQFAQAVELLTSMGLPRRKHATLKDIFKSDGLIPSPTEEWAKLIYAKTEGLSHMIASIPGVVSAEVSLANPQKKDPFEKLSLPSASVIVTVFKDSIQPELVPQIKQLVAFSVENIAYDRVSVIVASTERPKRQPSQTIEAWGVKLFKSSVLAALEVLAAAVAAATLLTAATIYAITIIRHRKKRGSE